MGHGESAKYGFRGGSRDPCKVRHQRKRLEITIFLFGMEITLRGNNVILPHASGGTKCGKCHDFGQSQMIRELGL